jgi:hypothetical protein
MIFRLGLNLLRAACFGYVLLSFGTEAQTLELPPRATNALTASQWTNVVWQLSRDERENWIYAQVMSGNIPSWQRTLKPVNVSVAGHTATYYVTPDYLAIGSDTDYFLQPTTPLLAQRLADALGCTLPTRKMVNQIWTNSAVKMNPQPIAPSAEMITMPVFATHNVMVRSQRNTFTNVQPLGALVGGDKKDVIISSLIYSNLQTPPKPVVIYGWHYPNGDPIQPAYNGHEETYADYSHGIRLVQMNLFVDGVANTVTNVLTSPTLAGLLSDETIAPNNTIPTPRYSVGALSPAVLVPPRSRSVLSGQTVTFSALAIGSAQSYQWFLNSNWLSGATNITLTLSNVQSADGGNYAIAVSNISGCVTSRLAVLRLKQTDFPILFADDFNTNSAGNWNLVSGQSSGPADYTADFAFDYGALPYTFNGVTALIPSAPNSPDGSTRGLKLTVNNNDATAATAAVNLYPKNFLVSNDFSLKFDLWINYPGNAGGLNSTGSTQFAVFGLNHTGTNLNWPMSTNGTDGLFFAVDGEGGTSADYRAYLGGTNLPAIDVTSSSGISASNNVAASYQALFPATRFETTGSPGKNWVEVELRQTNNVVVWLIDGTVIARRLNTSGFTNGTIMLGLMDVFNSIANPVRDCFVIFDNVRVENLSPPITFQSLTRDVNGNVSLTICSALGDGFQLESSTNLLNWQAVASFTLTNHPFTFVVTNHMNRPTVFYRARR